MKLEISQKLLLKIFSTAQALFSIAIEKPRVMLRHTKSVARTMVCKYWNILLQIAKTSKKEELKSPNFE